MNKNQIENAILEKHHKRNGVQLPLECILRESPASESRIDHSPPHYHDYIEFLFGLEDCDVNAWVAGEWIRFRTGDLLIINASVAHKFQHLLPRNRYICLKILPEVIYFSENPMFDVKYVVPFLQHNLIPYQFFNRQTLKDSPVPAIIIEMMNAWNKEEYGYEIALKSMFLQIFLWVIRFNHRNNATPMTPDADVSGENVRLIQRSVEYINQNYAEINEADAAAFVNMSYSYYSKLFRRVVGKNWADYVTTVRINEAERLLLSSDLSITEIAFATGFSTSSHFIEKFRKIKKTTPKQYRLHWGKS